MRRINQRGLLATLENEKIEAAAPVDTDTPTDTPASDAADTPAAVDTPAPADTPAPNEPAPVVDQPAVPVEDPAVTTVVTATDAVEADIAESSGEEADADSMTDATEEAVEVATALESIRDILAASLPNGGISKTDAGALKVAVESLNGRVGLGALAQPFPPAEQFDTVSGRMRATKLACESLSENAKKIWEKIIAAIKAAIAWLVERFQLFWNNAEKLSKRADEVIKMAASAKGEPKKKEFASATLVQALHIAGKVDAMQAIALLKSGVSEILTPKTETFAVVEKMVSDLQASVNLNALVEDVLPRGVGIKEVSDPKSDGLSVPEGATVHRGPELPGGKALVGYIYKLSAEDEKDQLRATDVVTKAMVQVADGWPNIKANSEQLIAVLSPSDVEKLAKEVKAVCKTIIDFKAAVDKRTDAKNKVIKAAEKLLKDDTAGQDQERMKKRGKLALWAVNMLDAPVAGLTLYTLLTCKRMLDYGTSSLKQYGEEKKPEDKPAAAAA